MRGSYFVVELKIVSVAYLLRSELFCFFCEFKVISARVSVADRLGPSYRICFVAVSVFATGSVSHDCHAFSVVVWSLCQHSKFISLAA